MACGGPDDVVPAAATSRCRSGPARVADGGDAADDLAGVLAYELRGGPAQGRRRRCAAAVRAVSTRWPPEVRISTGEPSASKSRLLAIAPTSHPSASAASAAVCTESGRITISPVPPRRVCSARNRADRGVLARSCRDPSQSGAGRRRVDGRREGTRWSGSCPGRSPRPSGCVRAVGGLERADRPAHLRLPRRPGRGLGGGQPGRAGRSSTRVGWRRCEESSINIPSFVPLAIVLFVVYAALTGVLVVFFRGGHALGPAGAITRDGALRRLLHRGRPGPRPARGLRRCCPRWPWRLNAALAGLPAGTRTPAPTSARRLTARPTRRSPTPRD